MLHYTWIIECLISNKNKLETYLVVVISPLSRHEDVYKRNLLCLTATLHKGMDGEELCPRLVHYAEGTVQVPRPRLRQKLQLSVGVHDDVASSINPHIYTPQVGCVGLQKVEGDLQQANYRL